MKTLKFMLAAATAIGLASATQAAVDKYSSTGFEKLAVGTSVTNGVKDNDSFTYFYYAGSNAEDNESVIAEGTPNIARPRGASTVDAGCEKILQVSTGKDPLIRTYGPCNGNSLPTATELTDDVYVDTLVQFTVTPYTDPVTPGDNDKLMIYLKESVVTNEFGVITSASTNLVVVGGYMVEDGVFEPKEYKVTGVNIQPNTWHRLTVKAIANYGAIEDYYHPAFLIYLDGASDPCVLDDLAIAGAETATGYVAPFDDDSLTLTELDEKNLVFSLKCDSQTAASLQGVGFAGEGKVDDIVFSDIDPFDFSIVDFTLVNGTNAITGVSFTIAGGEPITQFGTKTAHTNDTIVITPTYDTSKYEVVWPQNVTGLRYVEDGKYVLTDTATLTLTVQDAPQQADWAADPTQIADNTPASTQYPALSGSALATADARKLTVWATDNNIDFSAIEGDTTGTYTEAYLLNCALAEVEDEKDEFVLTITFDSEGNPVVNLPAGKEYNGTLQLKGKADLTDADWSDVDGDEASYNFFKYELSL